MIIRLCVTILGKLFVSIRASITMQEKLSPDVNWEVNCKFSLVLKISGFDYCLFKALYDDETQFPCGSLSQLDVV